MYTIPTLAKLYPTLREQLLMAQENVVFHCFTSTNKTSYPQYHNAIHQYKENWYAILAQANLPEEAVPNAVNAVHAHLINALKNFLLDKAKQLFQTRTQINFSSPPSYLFHQFIAFLDCQYLHQ